MPASIFSGQKVKALKNTFSINGNMDILYVTSDPTSVATDAPAGSIISYNGFLYRKTVSGSNTSVETLGAASGGSINYIENNVGESGSTTGWTTFNDATNYTDGTGGSPTGTWTINSTNPLRGSKDFLWTPGVAGDGVSYTWTPQKADLGSVITASFDIIQGSNYTDNDFEVWFYDVTNAVAIQPSSYKILKSLIQGRVVCQFQLPISTSLMRFSIYQKAVTASASAIQFDNFQLGPQSVARGAVVTDWQSYIPTFTGFGTVSVYSADWRRSGDTLHVRCRFTSGTNTAVAASVSFPSGLVASSPTTYFINHGQSTDSTNYNYQVSAGSGSTGFSFFANTAAGTQLNGSSFANGTVLLFEGYVKILGWSSNTILSSDSDGRVNAFNVVKSGNQTLTSGSAQTITAWTLRNQTHNMFDTTTGIFTAPNPGYYDFTATMSVTMGATAPGEFSAYLYKNDTATMLSYDNNSDLTANKSYVFDASISGVYLIAGDTVRFKGNASNQNVTVNGSLCFFAGHQVQGPNTISAAESVYASYTVDGGGQDLKTSGTLIQWNTKLADTHGIVTTGSSWKATVPISGAYLISLNLLSVNLTGTTPDINIRKNGTTGVHRTSPMSVFGIAAQSRIVYSGLIRLNAGEYIDVVTTGTATTYNAYTGATDSFFSITRVGNH